MVRQKVKGTGHKQPADVSSEPNFYSMPAVEPEDRLASFGARYKPTIVNQNEVVGPSHYQRGHPGDSSFGETDDKNQDARSDSSPDSSSVQGAASLLHGFASSFGEGSAFLGPAATAASWQGQNQRVENSSPRQGKGQPPASFVPPRRS